MRPTKFHKPARQRHDLVCAAPFLPFYQQELPVFGKKNVPVERVPGRVRGDLQFELFELDVDYRDVCNRMALHLRNCKYNLKKYIIYDFRRNCLGDAVRFSDFVPRRKLRLLRYHFGSIVAKVPELDGMTTKLYDAGKFLVGDVVQMTPSQIEEVTGATPDEMNSLVRTLANFDLVLGKRIANWSSERLKFDDHGR